MWNRQVHPCRSGSFAFGHYCPSDITQKDIFCLAFYFKNILFRLTISYQKPFVFSVSLFCSQISTLKLNLRPKLGLTYAISIVKWFFLNFLLRRYFFTFLCCFLNYWCFITILWKFEKSWTSRTCWKYASKSPTSQVSA